MIVAVVPCAILADMLVPYLLGQQTTAAGFIVLVLLVCSVVGHRIRNYLWANLVGVSALILVRCLAAPPPFFSYRDLASILLLLVCGLINAKMMLLLRESLGI